MEKDLVEVALNCLNNGVQPKELNQTLVVLISKITALENMKWFRPISLCIFAYKTISKAIVNKFKPFLPKFVAPTQSSFIPGQNITDNIIVYQEILHSFKKKYGNVGGMMIKLDLENTYDILNRKFI